MLLRNVTSPILTHREECYWRNLTALSPTGIIRQSVRFSLERTIFLGSRNIPKEFHWPVIFLLNPPKKLTSAPLNLYPPNSFHQLPNPNLILSIPRLSHAVWFRVWVCPVSPAWGWFSQPRGFCVRARHKLT